MKTFTWLLRLSLAFTSGVLFLPSCTEKKQSGNTSDSTAVVNKTAPITGFRVALSNLNIADQKAIFRGLSPDVRAALWQDRIQEALTMSLTKEQKEALQQIATHLTPAVYNPDSSMQQKAFAGFYSEWYTKAWSVFKQDSATFVTIATQLGSKNQTAMIAQAAPVPSCDCNLAARQTNCDDCWLTNCKRITCTASAIGCGCWWLSACDGVCK